MVYRRDVLFVLTRAIAGLPHLRSSYWNSHSRLI